jgi:hypothetical protein
MPMSNINTNKPYHCRFDFEVGHLVKSPCKECDIREDFPKCADHCQTLEEIHSILSATVSCSLQKS